MPPAVREACPECGHEQDAGRFCERCGARLPARTDPEASPAARRRPWLALGAVIGAAVVAAIAWPTGADAPPDAVTAPIPVPADTPTGAAEPAGLGFTGQTDTVLVFDDRHTGAVAIHLDSGARTHVDLHGQRFGARPYRLILMGSWIVVGRGEIWAVALGGEHDRRRLGTATTVLPAAQPIELWFVDEPSSTWTLVDASGNPIASVDAPRDHVPLRGVPGGLAARDPEGQLVRYDVERDALVDEVGGPGARIADVAVERVVWCEQDCPELIVAGVARAATGDREPIRTLSSPAVEAFHADAAWLSGGADRLAVAVSLRGGARLQTELWIYDVESGRRIDRTPLPLGPVRGAWTRDGRQFFSWVHVPQALSPLAPSQLTRWHERTGFEQVHLDPQRASLSQFVAFPEGVLPGLFDPDRG